MSSRPGRYSVDAVATFDTGKDGNGMLLANVALEPWSVTPTANRDARSGLVEGDSFFVNLRFELKPEHADAGYFVAEATTPSLRGDSNGVAIIADTTSGGPGYLPRPPDMEFEGEGLQVQNWGWRVRLLSGGEATFKLPSPVSWYLGGEAMDEAEVIVTLTFRAES